VCSSDLTSHSRPSMMIRAIVALTSEGCGNDRGGGTRWQRLRQKVLTARTKSLIKVLGNRECEPADALSGPTDPPGDRPGHTTPHQERVPWLPRRRLRRRRRRRPRRRSKRLSRSHGGIGFGRSPLCFQAAMFKRFAARDARRECEPVLESIRGGARRGGARDQDSGGLRRPGRLGVRRLIGHRAPDIR